MDVYWANNKLKLQLEDATYLSEKYDKKEAEKIPQRIKELVSFPSYADLPPNARKHSIKDGNKFLYFGIDIPSLGGGRGKRRMIFEPYGEYDLANQKTITAVKILGIIDYHH